MYPKPPFEWKKDPQNDCWIGPDGCHYDVHKRGEGALLPPRIRKADFTGGNLDAVIKEFE